jgi:nucleotide-binding universal stress UspA family protein
MYKRILVPLDGSDTAQRGLAEAIGLARSLRATLHLLHVVTDFPIVFDMGASIDTETLRAELRRYADTLLTAAAKSVAEQDVACEAAVRDSMGPRPAQMIIDEAVSAECDLIVMGTHGRRGVSRLLLGSDAALVVQASRVPVLLVGAHVDASRR